MGTFITAYVVVWSAVTLFVARLGIRQRRLEQRVDALRTGGSLGEPVSSTGGGETTNTLRGDEDAAIKAA